MRLEGRGEFQLGMGLTHDSDDWLSYVVAPRSSDGGQHVLYLKYDSDNDSYYPVGGALGVKKLEE